MIAKKAYISLTVIISVILLTIVIASTLYIREINFLTKITVISGKQFKIIAYTPFDNQISFNVNNDTLVIFKRPLKSIIIANGKSQFEIYSVADLIEFTKTNEQVIIIVEDKFISKFDVFYWYLEAHPIIKIALFSFFITFLLSLSFVILTKTIIKRRILKYWNKIKFKFYRFLLKNNSSPKTTALPIKLNSFNKYLLISLCIIIIPILYTLLDRPYSSSDEEKKRALVALEMRMQNNYIVPTLAGEPYCNKPPVFNWIIAPFIKMDKVECVTRSISVSLFILCAIALFFLIKKGTNWQHALLTSFFFLSSFHLLLNLSLFLYIDGLFVFLLLLMLYFNLHLVNKEKYLQAFIVGYSLCAFAFLTKGVPALWFQAVSIFSILLINKKLRILYSYKHFVGIFIFLIITGSYFYLYFLETNSISMLNGLIGEIERKVSFTSLNTTFLHMLAFPVNALILPYAPIGLLFPLLFYRKNLILIIKDKKLSYMFINLFMGISIFLSSNSFCAYYILMYIPFFIELILYLIKPFSLLKTKNIWFFIVLGNALFLLFGVSAFYNFQASFINIILLITSFAILISLIAFLRKNIISILLFIGLLFMGTRLFENSFKNVLIPEEPNMTNVKTTCENISKKLYDKKFYVFSSKNSINSAPIFYLSYYLDNTILFYDKCVDYNNSVLIIDKCSLWKNQPIIDSIPHTSENNGKWEYNPLYIIQFNQSIANRCDEFSANRNVY